MKNRIILLFIGAIGILMVGCNGDSQFGFDNEDKVEKRHREGNNFGVFESGDVIKYCPRCSKDNGNGWNGMDDLIAEAIAEFDKLDIGLEFEYSCDNPDIIFTCFEDPDNCTGGGATAGTPIEIRLNTALDVSKCPLCFEFNSTSDCKKKGTIIHETMHALGFGHTDDMSLELIDGTAVMDPNSIVRDGSGFDAGYEYWCEGICVFSSDDIIALETVFPCESESTPMNTSNVSVEVNDFTFGNCTNNSIQPGEILNIEIEIGQSTNYDVYIEYECYGTVERHHISSACDQSESVEEWPLLDNVCLTWDPWNKITIVIVDDFGNEIRREFDVSGPICN